MRSATTFTVPPELSAGTPPEARGLARDGVRLLVAGESDQRGDGLRHARFTDLPAALDPGDLVVVNTSDTEPAALDAHREDGRPAVLHVSGPTPRGGRTGRLPSARDDGIAGFVVELRTPDGERVTDATAGERIRLPCGVTATLLAGYPDAGVAAGSRLWLAHLPTGGGVPHFLAETGRPIRYPYLRGNWALPYYRTVFARRAAGLASGGSGWAGPEFASAEMPSAGRPFTAAVLDGLRARRVGIAEVVLHTGVSSLEAGETPLPERYRVPRSTASAVNATRACGGRVVAVGTTVTRALETVADGEGTLHAGAGWTDLVLGPDRPARVVDGLVTGWHEPEASHLLLLEAVAGTALVGRAYAAALQDGYLWHEFGDSCVLLPARTGARRVG